jgi:hypothetical protein
MTRHLRGVLCAAVVAAAAAPDSAAQEVTVHLAVGARAATTLVHDSIVVPIDVRARPGPAVALGADLALDSTWTARLTLDAAWNALAGHAAGAPTSELGTIRTVAATLTLHRRLRRGIGATSRATRVLDVRPRRPPRTSLRPAHRRYGRRRCDDDAANHANGAGPGFS